MCNALNHAPGCTCGFGGEGHLGTSSGSVGWFSTGSDGICRPTTCKFCNERVFFVKHNGGSVLFNALGWPWPKHDCWQYRAKMSRDEQRVFANISLCMTRMSEPQVAVVTKAFVQKRSGETMTILEVACSDNTMREIRLMVNNCPVNALTKELVVFSLLDTKLARPHKNVETTYAIQLAPKLQMAPKTASTYWRRRW